MPFGFGGSTSSTVSNSFSRDESKAGSVSGGRSGAISQDSVAFEDVFARLFGGAEGAAAGLDPSMLTEAANTLFSGGTGFMDSLGANTATDYMNERLGSENPVLQDQIDLLSEDIGGFFNEQLLPGITSEAVGGGQLGGGRQGVAQGRAIEEAGDMFTRGATALRAGDINARDAVAGTLGQNTIGSAMAGFQGIPALAGIADMGFGASMSPYERLAGIMGGPTTLNSSVSSASDFARSFSESFGMSSANITSKSKAFKLGL